MIIDVEAEINKHKNCTDRDKLERQIQEYKNLARDYASNFTLAGKYNMVARKLQEICDKLPAPRLRNVTSRASNAPVKTATITKEEDAKIKDAWKKRAGGTNSGVKN